MFKTNARQIIWVVFAAVLGARVFADCSNNYVVKLGDMLKAVLSLNLTVHTLVEITKKQVRISNNFDFTSCKYEIL